MKKKEERKDWNEGKEEWKERKLRNGGIKKERKLRTEERKDWNEGIRKNEKKSEK